MLVELDIRNYAIIDRVKLSFSPGLNVLTGETGAGKSIIIGAMGLILGERAPTDVIRTGAESAKVSATFDISKSARASEFLSTMNLINEDEPEMLTLTRDVSKNGRSRCWINDSAVTLSTFKRIGDYLVDIHGQHEHQTLFRSEEHLKFLDDFGGLLPLRKHLEDSFSRLRELRTKYYQILRDRDEKLKEKELLEFQLKELKDAKLEEGEEEKLGYEKQILNNAESLFELANSIYERLYGGEPPQMLAVLDALKLIRADFVRLLSIDNRLEEIKSRFENALYELEDIASSIQDYRDHIYFDPQRLSIIEARLDRLFRLKRKYGVDSISELISFMDSSARKLEDIRESSSTLEEIQREVQQAHRVASEIALELSRQRCYHAERLKSLVERELHTLGMEKTVFEVRVVKNEITGQAEGLSFYIEDNGRRFKLSADGIDSVEFLISPNIGEELRPLHRIASGGEISRIMLALKTVLATGVTHEVQVSIFDEIDTGIGGRIAEVVGRKLKELARQRQVICITHLPQIASLADSHCLVQKKVIGDRTVVDVLPLSDDEKVKEVARMLAGEKITDVTMAHAREMVEHAKGE